MPLARATLWPRAPGNKAGASRTRPFKNRLFLRFIHGLDADIEQTGSDGRGKTKAVYHTQSAVLARAFPGHDSFRAACRVV